MHHSFVPCSILIFLLQLFIASGSEAAATAQTCASPETVFGQDEYNALVCEGIGLLSAAANTAAADRLQQALELKLFEVPNFRPLARLALAQFRAGQENTALATLEQAELSLQVLIGAARCIETEEGYEIVHVLSEELRSDSEELVTRRMCGIAYDGSYLWLEFDAFLRDAELIRQFVDIRREVCSFADLRNSTVCLVDRVHVDETKR
ncbi:MAG: hypothetical protein AB7P44_13165 [Steroidobacteraceae bacterium]